MRKKSLSKVIVSAVMNLYHGIKTKLRVALRLSEKFWVQVVYIKNVPCLRCFLKFQLM